MSDPRRHRWADEWFTFGDSVRIGKHDVRWTRTSGPEWDALMERARATLPSGGAHTFADVMQLLMDRGDILRDLIAYLGEKP